LLVGVDFQDGVRERLGGPLRHVVADAEEDAVRVRTGELARVGGAVGRGPVEIAADRDRRDADDRPLEEQIAARMTAVRAPQSKPATIALSISSASSSAIASIAMAACWPFRNVSSDVKRVVPYPRRYGTITR
jgi:hypothetical protein